MVQIEMCHSNWGTIQPETFIVKPVFRNLVDTNLPHKWEWGNTNLSKFLVLYGIELSNQ